MAFASNPRDDLPSAPGSLPSVARLEDSPKLACDERNRRNGYDLRLLGGAFFITLACHIGVAMRFNLVTDTVSISSEKLLQIARMWPDILLQSLGLALIAHNAFDQDGNGAKRWIAWPSRLEPGHWLLLTSLMHPAAQGVCWVCIRIARRELSSEWLLCEGLHGLLVLAFYAAVVARSRERFWWRWYAWANLHTVIVLLLLSCLANFGQCSG